MPWGWFRGLEGADYLVTWRAQAGLIDNWNKKDIVCTAILSDYVYTGPDDYDSARPVRNSNEHIDVEYAR